MNEVDQFALACEELHRKSQWEEISTQRTASVMLMDLLRMLHDAKAFCDRHEVSFKLIAIDAERIVGIYHAGLPAGRWERGGDDTLHLYAADFDEPLSVKTTKGAFEATVYFINDMAKVIARYVVEPQINALLPPPQRAEAPKFGFIPPSRD